MAGASALLMLRALALWRWDLRVAGPTIILHLAQWGIYLHDGAIAKEVWGSLGDGTMGCVPTTVTWPWVQAQFVFAVAFDFIILCLAMTALLRMPGRSSLWNLIFLDGLSYFIVAFLCYVACVIPAFAGAGVFVTFIFWNVATAGVTIASCRSFVRIATRSGIPKPVTDIDIESPQPISTGFEFAPIKKGPVTTSGSAGENAVGWKSTHVQASVTFDPDASFKEPSSQRGSIPSRV